jgi:hypothetical protein
VLVVQRGVGGSTFGEYPQGGAILHGVHQLIGVDVLAEALHRALVAVLLGDQRGASEGDSRRLGKRLGHVVAEIGALGAVRLVDHQQDMLRAVHHAEALA